MNGDDFIITVYGVVCEHSPALKALYRLHHGGFPPARSDDDVIPMEICGAFCKCPTDKDIFAYFRAHSQPCLPHLHDRTLLVRHAAHLWQIKAALQHRLTVVSGQVQDPVQIIDTRPLPVCGYTRSRRDRCFKAEADDGYCAAQDLPDYGFTLGLRIARSGMILHFPLLPARPHDMPSLDELVAGFVGIVPADKGCIDAVRQALLAERHGVMVITPPRQGMATAISPGLLKACTRLRKCVETVASHLMERFAVTRIRVHDLWHFQHRLLRKVLAHTIGVFLHLQLGRAPLDIDGLVIA